MTRNLGPLLIILIVLVAAVSANYAKTGEWPAFLEGLAEGVGLREPALSLVESAPRGEVVNGFPIGMISLVSDAKVVESGLYRDTETGGEVLVASYSTSASISQMFAAYINYLTDRGYEVVSADAKRGVTLITAESSSNSVALRMESKGLAGNLVRIDVSDRVIE